MQSIGIIGGGAWGTALAIAARRAGRDVVMWARDPATVAEIVTRHTNARYLPGITFDPAIAATDDLGRVASQNAVLLVAPAQSTREMAARLAPLMPAGVPLVLCAKGLDLATGRLLDAVVREAMPNAAIAVLSGPGFAGDVARGLPTAITLAAADVDLGQRLAEALGSSTFRPYWSSDLAGVQLGGAVKNVLAIAAGMVAGRELGASASAALITRGFAEMRRLADALGARPETLMGLSGFGDLVLTCSGPKSRNFAYGLALGAPGRHAAPTHTTEGVATARAVMRIASERGVAMPVSEAVAAILDGRLTIDDAMAGLMLRPLRAED